MKKLFHRLVGSALLLVAMTAFSGAMSVGTTYAATKSHNLATAQATHSTHVRPFCSASVHFSPDSQTTHLGSRASVTAAVTCTDWLWGTDVAFNWGDGTGWHVQNTKDYTTFTHVYARTGAYTAYGHVNGVPGNNVLIVVS